MEHYYGNCISAFNKSGMCILLMIAERFPTGTIHRNDVAVSSKQRGYVSSTYVRCDINPTSCARWVICRERADSSRVIINSFIYLFIYSVSLCVPLPDRHMPS